MAAVFLKAFLVWRAGKGLEVQALPGWREKPAEILVAALDYIGETKLPSRLSFLLKTVAES